MKKFFAFLLAFAMMFSLCGVAMAAGSGNINDDGAVSGGKQGDVVIKVTGVAGDAAKIYYVVIDWGTLTFTYDFGQTKTWDPSNHKFNTAGTGGWVQSDSTKAATVSSDITVTNHSNGGVKVTAALAGAENANKGTAAAALNKDSLTLTAAEANNDFNDAPFGSFTVTVSGVPGAVNSTAEGFKIGTITLTIVAN